MNPLAGSARRVSASIGLSLALGSLGIACPDKVLTVEVTDSGIAVLTLACRNYEGACAEIKSKLACNADLTCRWDVAQSGCRLASKCVREGNPNAATDALKAVRVLLVGQNPVELKAKSKCVLLLRSTDPACQSPTVEERSACAVSAVNAAIDAAIRGGLTYSGFGDPAQAFPVLAIYQPAALPPGCQGGIDASACAKATLDCPVEELVSCAGLAVPVNHDTYDITCASCQSGLHFSVGVDTGPCPVVGGACFFDTCASALERL